MGFAELFARAERQHGVIRISDAPDDDVDLSTLYERMDRERWRRPVVDVAIVPGSPRSHEQRAMVQVTSIGGKAVVTRGTAAYLYGLLDNAPGVVDVLIRHGRRAPKRAGLRVLRSTTIEDEDRTVVNGIPCVSVPRMLLDLAMVCNTAELRRFVVDAIQRRLVTLDQIVERFARVGRGLAGRGRLRRVCYELDGSRVDSIFERVIRRWLRANGFDPDPHPVSHSGRGINISVDIGFSRWTVGVECKGFAYHSTRSQLTKDGQRNNTAALITDWTILVIDWDRYENDPDGFLDELRAAIEGNGGLAPARRDEAGA